MFLMKYIDLIKISVFCSQFHQNKHCFEPQKGFGLYLEWEQKNNYQDNCLGFEFGMVLWGINYIFIILSYCL